MNPRTPLTKKIDGIWIYPQGLRMIGGIILLFFVGLGVFLYKKGYFIQPHKLSSDFYKTRELSSDVYKTPILSTISYILGVLLIGIGLIMFLFVMSNSGKDADEALVIGVSFCIGGLIQFGIGQVVEYLAKTSYCCFLISKSIQPIDAKLIAIQKEVASLSAQKEKFNESSISSIQNYYWMIDGQQYGPESLKFVKNLFHQGEITLETQIFMEGGNIWITVNDCPEITS